MKNSWESLLEKLPQPILNHIQHLERMRQDFVANVSHELRTPLTIIHGYLETLLTAENLSQHDLPKIFTQMYQQTLRMENLIADLLLLSSLENDENKAPYDEIIDVGHLLTTICAEASELSGQAKHNISMTIDHSLKLKGNKNELHSLFSNIIFNAVKYTPAQGDIEVYWEKSSKQACFKVKDTGIGIEEKHLPRLTERFYRVDKGRSRESGGTGLGLAIVKHVLLRHDGEITIASKPGEGSTFTCLFLARRCVYQKSP